MNIVALIYAPVIIFCLVRYAKGHFDLQQARINGFKDGVERSALLAGASIDALHENKITHTIEGKYYVPFIISYEELIKND